MEPPPRGESKAKVLLMGRSGSGKTSMRSIIFANYLARATARLNPTLDVQHSSVRFLGRLQLNMWDCGGQDAFYDSYFVSRREHIFRNVAALIYVFDVGSGEWERDLDYYGGTVEALAQLSPGAAVFALVHKFDLVPEDARNRVFDERAQAITARSFALRPTVFRTSIWDETLYRAWSVVVAALVPNLGALETQLGGLADACGADEAVLFERASFLVIASSVRRAHPDVHRFEKVSNIVKQFKLACSKAQAQLQGLRVGNSTYTVFVDAFTSNTYLLVVTSAAPRSAAGAVVSGGVEEAGLGKAGSAVGDGAPAAPAPAHVQPPDEATLLNIALARDRFERLIAQM